MKKFTLFMALFVCAIGFSQTRSLSEWAEQNPQALQQNTTNVVVQNRAAIQIDRSSNATAFVNTLGENNPNVYQTQTINRAACSTNGPSNVFENGKSFTFNLGRIVAHDIEVVADENMSLETISLNAFIGGVASGVNASFVDVHIYDDAGGMPGAEIAFEAGVVPTTQTVVGDNFGFDLWEVMIDITPVALAGQAGIPTTYWIGVSLEPTDASNTFWENSTAGLVGNGEAYDDGAGGGYLIDATLEGVYTFSGDCTPIGGGGACDFEEDFDAGLPADWSTHITSGGCDWQNGTDLPTGDDFATPGMFYDDDDACGLGGGADPADVELWSATYDLAGATAIELTCDVAFQESTDGEQFGIDVWDGFGWQPIVLYEDDLDPDIQTVTFDVSAYENEFFTVRWRYQDAAGSWGWHGGVDNFCLNYTPGGGGGGCTAGVYTDRASFDAEAGTLPLEDFAGGPGTGISGCGEVISDAGDGTCYPAGEILPGVAITTNVPVNATLYVHPDGGFGNTIEVVGTNTFSDFTIMNFPNDDVNAFGFELYSLFEGTLIDIRIFGAGGLITTENITTTNGAGVFFGYIADETIVSVEIEDLTGLNVEVFGMLAFGACSTVGTSDNTIEGFSYYPNPATNVLNLSSQENIESVSIYNILGQKVVDLNVNATSTQLDVDHLTTGTYIMKVSVEGQTGTYKIIKN